MPQGYFAAGLFSHFFDFVAFYSDVYATLLRLCYADSLHVVVDGGLIAVEVDGLYSRRAGGIDLESHGRDVYHEVVRTGEDLLRLAAGSVDTIEVGSDR